LKRNVTPLLNRESKVIDIKSQKSKLFNNTDFEIDGKICDKKCKKTAIKNILMFSNFQEISKRYNRYNAIPKNISISMEKYLR
jgi:hypothetical protein